MSTLHNTEPKPELEPVEKAVPKPETDDPIAQTNEEGDGDGQEDPSNPPPPTGGPGGNNPPPPDKP